MRKLLLLIVLLSNAINAQMKVTITKEMALKYGKQLEYYQITDGINYPDLKDTIIANPRIKELEEELKKWPSNHGGYYRVKEALDAEPLTLTKRVPNGNMLYRDGLYASVKTYFKGTDLVGDFTISDEVYKYYTVFTNDPSYPGELFKLDESDNSVESYVFWATLDRIDDEGDLIDRMQVKPTKIIEDFLSYIPEDLYYNEGFTGKSPDSFRILTRVGTTERYLVLDTYALTMRRVCIAEKMLNYLSSKKYPIVRTESGNYSIDTPEVKFILNEDFMILWDEDNDIVQHFLNNRKEVHLVVNRNALPATNLGKYISTYNSKGRFMPATEREAWIALVKNSARDYKRLFELATYAYCFGVYQEEGNVLKDAENEESAYYKRIECFEVKKGDSQEFIFNMRESLRLLNLADSLGISGVWQFRKSYY